MTVGQVLLLSAAAFLAGALNAVAGGGSFLTLPALVVVGASPLVANATGTVALVPGYLSGAWGFRQELRAPPGLSMRALIALGAVGGALGALLLLVTPPAAFRRIVPWLLLAATAIFALAPRLLRAARAGAGARTAAAGVLLVCVYGGYFNGGLGVLLLALLALLGQSDLNAMNGVKNLLSAAIAVVAVFLYASGGLVRWPEAALMTVGATAGGYVGARLARRVPGAWLRAGIVVTGLAMTAAFFARG